MYGDRSGEFVFGALTTTSRLLNDAFGESSSNISGNHLVCLV